jgi:hypothetical protein
MRYLYSNGFCPNPAFINEINMTKQLFILAIISLGAYGCKHDDGVAIGGKGGNASITVYPQHHDVAKNIINFKAYIKYNTLNAPANDAYDDSIVCTNHDNLVSGTFSNLTNGNYYLFGRGTDTSIAEEVKGGISYTIKQQKAQDVELPVSED